jgi:quinol-cytochrome oxidoreductase complex cytochrome b subunit
MSDTSDRTADESPGLPQRPGVPEVGFILVVGVLLAGLLLAGPTTPARLATTFYLALFIHILVSACHGRFGGWRTVTFVLLIAAWLAAEIGGFLGMVMPFGQFSLWLSRMVGGAPSTGSWLVGLLEAWVASPGAPWLGYTAVTLVLLLDIVAMQAVRWRRMSRLQRTLLSAAAVVAAWILAPLLASLAPEAPPGGIRLFPYWYMLPLYSLLRSVPDKLAGVVLVFAAMLVPLVLPFARIDKLHGRLLRGLWIVLSLALAGCWIWLGQLGLASPDDPALSLAPALAGFHFAYFLLFPFLFRGLARYFRARREEATTLR